MYFALTHNFEPSLCFLCHFLVVWYNQQIQNSSPHLEPKERDQPIDKDGQANLVASTISQLNKLFYVKLYK